MSAHHTPEEIRKDLTHPVVDGDGHWVEYGPVFAEQLRKVTGDLGANDFLSISASSTRRQGWASRALPTTRPGAR